MMKNIIIKGGSFRNLKKLLGWNSASRPLLVTDHRLKAPIECFKDMFPLCTIYDKVVNEPDIDTVKSIQQIINREKLTGLVAIGGGSPIDAAKAANCLRFDEKNSLHLLLKEPKLQFIAIPTTAGTGSEVTPFSVIKVGKEKVLISDQQLIPTVAIIDYELTMSMPPLLTAITGMDALCHALEAYVSNKSTACSDDFALAALHDIGMSIEECVHNPTHNSRRLLMLASTHAGIAFSNSSVTLVHGMSRPLGRFDIPHGMANAQLVASITDYSQSHITDLKIERYKQVKDSLCPYDPRPLEVYLDDLVEKLKIPTLKDSVNIPDYLNVVDDMVTDAVKSGSHLNNPRSVTNIEIRNLYIDLVA